MKYDRDEQAQRLAPLLAQGMSLSAASRAIGLNTATVRSWFRDGGAFRQAVETAQQDAPEPATALDELVGRVSQVMPSLPRMHHTPLVSGADDEEANLILSDMHCGRRTRTFNSKVYAERAQQIVDKVIHLTEMYRKTGKALNRLNIFDLGDNLHGEYTGRQGRMQDFEFGVPEQLAQSVPVMSEMYFQLAEMFPFIRVYRSPGNHGDLDKQFSTGSNWDAVRGMLIEKTFEGYDNFEMFPPEDPNQDAYQTAAFGPWRFAYGHGHCIKSSGGGPYSSIIRKFQSFQVIEAAKGQPFHLAMLGHFHHSFYVNQNRMRILMNGTMVTDDPYALQLGYDSDPAQWFFGFNSKRPVTFKFELELDERRYTA
ncbi:hypothetical protein LCGC14_0423480 [marine sediment metagenome]|uniref:Calcineurin-like phosphoesterase domain-containing protein n=1 Tax=marine sediment metagenome TaxID=412755 RepID=A0A0F9SQ80_9ZZZZ